METQTSRIIEGYIYNGARSNLSNINAYSAALMHLGSEYAHTPWLYGAIGTPFLFRVVEDVNTEPVLYELPHSRIAKLLNNLGVRVEGLSAVAKGEELDKLRVDAWNAVTTAISAGFPCFGQGFYFSYGETSVVQGYDEAEEAYIISCWHGTKLIPKNSLGERDGLIDVHWMMPNGEEEDDRRTVREALRMAVEFSKGKLTGAHTMVGGSAYDHWVSQLRQGTVDGWFFAYNAHEWDTCRSNGYKFLIEAKQRLGNGAPQALDNAIDSFSVVREKFNQVYNLFPWEQPRGLIEDTERRLEAAKLLEEAKPYDAAVIDAFDRVVGELDE